MLAWLEGLQGQPSFGRKGVRDEEAAGRDRGDHVVTAVSEMMIFVNEATRQRRVTRDTNVGTWSKG